MKKSKKLLALILSVVMSVILVSQVSAGTQEYVEFYYEISDENGIVIEDGFVSVNKLGRILYNPITLANGKMATLKNTGEYYFYAQKNTKMTLKFTLDRLATVEVICSKSASITGTNSSQWRKSTITAGSVTYNWTTDETTYYAPSIRNASSDPIYISDISFVF